MTRSKITPEEGVEEAVIIEEPLVEVPIVEPVAVDVSRMVEMESLCADKDVALKEAQDKLLRSYAELENFKRRKEQEKIEFCKAANEKLLLALLPVLDSFDRALEHAQKEHDNSQEMIQGFGLIQQQFHSVLERQGVSKIESLQAKFDPMLHQAVMHEEVEGAESDMVVRVMQEGYRLGEKVLRPSMVAVSK